MWSELLRLKGDMTVYMHSSPEYRLKCMFCFLHQWGILPSLQWPEPARPCMLFFSEYFITTHDGYSRWNRKWVCKLWLMCILWKRGENNYQSSSLCKCRKENTTQFKTECTSAVQSLCKTLECDYYLIDSHPGSCWEHQRFLPTSWSAAHAGLGCKREVQAIIHIGRER